MNFREITPVSAEPLTLEQARTHLRLDVYGSPPEHPDDTYVQDLITAARQWCEDYLQRALATKTIEIVYDSFIDNKLRLPVAPIQSITSIEYIDTDGNTQTLATTVYGLDIYRNQIYLKYNQQWPDLQPTVNPVTVTAVVGYTDGQSPDPYPIPEPIRRGMLLIISNLYENRQQDQLGATRISFNSLPMGVYSILAPYRLGQGV